MRGFYEYLSTDVADSRYVLAAHYLASCTHIVEVGGHRLHHFMDHHLSMWSIDPVGVTEHHPHVRMLDMPVCNFDFDTIPFSECQKTGLCLLGLGLYDGEHGVGRGEASIQNVADNVARFDMVVVEFMPCNPSQWCKRPHPYVLAQVIDDACRASASLYPFIELELKFRQDNEYFSKQRPEEYFFRKRIFRVYKK
jgi:hypothetical protein